MIGKSDSYIYTFDNKKLEQKELLGDKGLSFSQIADLDFPTPETFVITSLAFDDFLLSANLVDPISKILKEVRPFVRESAEDASGKIYNLINNSKIPRVVGESISKIYNSIGKNSLISLNLEVSNIVDSNLVPRNQKNKKFIARGFDDLIKKIKLGWMTLFSPDAIELRTNSYYNGPLSIAFKVSKAVRAEISGLAFSVPPVTKEDDLVEIYAMYGLNDQDLDLESNCDSYKINIKTHKIVEKNIIPQEYMYIKTKSTSQQEESQVVEISNEWKKRQKIEDSRIIEIYRMAIKIESKLKHPVEVSWVIEAGNLFITDVFLHQIEIPANPLAKLDESDFLKHFPQEIIKESTKDADLNELEKEINEIIQQDNLKLNSNKKKSKSSLLEIRKKSGEPLFIPWSKKYHLVTDILLDITNLNYTSLNSIELFNGGFFDGTELILSSGELPEKSLKSVEETVGIINKFASEITLASKNLSDKQLIYQFSKINPFEYKLLNLNPNSTEYFGDERFIDNPKALQFEIRAIKLAKDEYDAKNLSILFPYVRSVENLRDLKSIVSSEGLRRSSITKFYAEVAVPSFAQDLENIEEDLVDGLIVDYLTLLKLSVYRETIRKADHEIVIKLIKEIKKIAKEKKLEFILKLDQVDSDVIIKLIELRPHAIIFTSILDEELVKKLQASEQKFLVKEDEKQVLHTKFEV